MGIRGELFSSKVNLPNRTYFFNVKENRMGDLYLNIVESKNRDNGGFDRQSVILFSEDLQEFLKGFDESLKIMEKAIREKRQTGKTSAKHDEGRDDKKRDNMRAGERSTRTSGSERSARGGSSERSARGSSSERSARGSSSERSARGSSSERTGGRDSRRETRTSDRNRERDNTRTRGSERTGERDKRRETRGSDRKMSERNRDRDGVYNRERDNNRGSERSSERSFFHSSERGIKSRYSAGEEKSSRDRGSGEKNRPAFGFGKSARSRTGERAAGNRERKSDRGTARSTSSGSERKPVKNKRVVVRKRD